MLARRQTRGSPSVSLYMLSTTQDLGIVSCESPRLALTQQGCSMGADPSFTSATLVTPRRRSADTQLIRVSYSNVRTNNRSQMTARFPHNLMALVAEACSVNKVLEWAVKSTPHTYLLVVTNTVRRI